MITDEEKRRFEEFKKEGFICDFLKRIKARRENGSCMGSISMEKLKKNTILLNKAYDSFKFIDSKDKAYNDTLNSVIDYIDAQVKSGVYYNKIWKFIRCDLDDEHYSDAEYTFFNTMEEGKRSCFAKFPFDPVSSRIEGSIEYKENFSLDNKPGSFRFSQQEGSSFYVTEILPYEASGEYACIWHHAYDGVGFEVSYVGSYDECLEYARKSAKKVFTDCKHGEYSEFTDQVIVDTENEWQVWDVVKLPD